MPYFPQVNGNLILTQTPYQWIESFDTIFDEQETGMKYSYPRRGVGLDNFPTDELGRFAVNFSSITDAEVAVLKAFFVSMRGRWGTFRLLDPGGNLLQYSEDFTQAYWAKTLTVGSTQSDPFGNSRAYSVSSGTLRGLVGAADGLMSGIRVCASLYANARSVGLQGTIGFVDRTTSTNYSTVFDLPNGGWKRIYHSFTLPTNNAFDVYLSFSGTCWVFGAQVSPMKGEGAYVKAPGNYGYHENCRFDTDVFERQVSGPDQNALQLPIVEFLA